MRILEANIDALEMLSPRRILHPRACCPSPPEPIPELFGVRASYATIHNLRLAKAAFSRASDDDASAAVCVLGQTAKINLLGYGAGGRQVSSR